MKHMKAKEIQELNLEISKMLRLVEVAHPYSGAVTPGQNTFKSEFFQSKIEGESWYLYPEFDKSFDWLMIAVEFINQIHNDNIPGRDNLYTIKYLLGGGYKFGSTEPLKSVPLTLENLFTNVGLFSKHYNQTLKVKEHVL